MNPQQLKHRLKRLVNDIFASLTAYARAITWLEGGALPALEDEHRVNW